MPVEDPNRLAGQRTPCVVRRLALATALLLAAGLCAAQTDPAAARPQLAGRTLQGEVVDLQQLRGKVVLLFLWSTECPVCLDKMPEFRRNLQGWHGKDFVIVAVNQDRTADDLRRYEQVLDTMMPHDAQMKIVWRRDPAHHDSLGEAPQRLPTTLILDRQGKVVRSVQGRIPPELWNDIADLVLN